MWREKPACRAAHLSLGPVIVNGTGPWDGDILSGFVPWQSSCESMFPFQKEFGFC
jgi:hypothetical protein